MVQVKLFYTKILKIFNDSVHLSKDDAKKRTNAEHWFRLVP